MMPLRCTVISVGLLELALLQLSACDTSTSYPTGSGLKEGEKCTSTGQCAVGLLCAGIGTCQLPGAKGTKEKGEGCAADPDCVTELVCTSGGVCGDPGKGNVGDACVTKEVCAKGLLCSSKGTCAKSGDPGAKPLGADCSEQLDCSLGLICLDGKCSALSFWTGVTCPEDNGPLRAYFEIPRATKKLADFYRLPFPNNIRLKNGHVDVSDHPNPGTAIPATYGDVVGSYLKAIGEDVTGFGLNTTVFMRISKGFDLDSIAFQFLNIDKASPGYGQGVGWNMYATSGGGKYICPNHIAVRPPVGHPLAAKTTYALILKTGIKDDKGTLAVQDADFKLVMADTEPSDAEEKAAWNAYAPLRAYLNDTSIKDKIAASEVLSAAVFTTMDPRTHMAALHAAVAAQPAPTPAGLTLCDGAAKSPCDDGKDASWVCPTSTDSAFHELQGTYQTPVFQQGTPPYKTAADGGAIQYDASGVPQLARQEKVCFALTVPKSGTMPAEGWPVAIFAHGTGGSYRSFITNGTAAGLAEIKDASGTVVSHMAVVGIDGSMHGPRRSSTDKPDDLFFNLRNPRAARDNTYQGAVDKAALLRLIQQINLDQASSPTGEALKLDPTRIYFFGHSQGTIEGIPFLAFEPEVKAAVLSGAGGYLIGSLLGKTKPVNIAGAVQFVLADGQVSTTHPLLNLLQLYFEEIDAVNYGAAMFAQPEKGVGAKHTFLGYGVSDSYSPPGTISALAWSMGIPQVKQEAQRCGDGVCNGTESCKTCEQDCKKCPDGATCGNGTCEAGERCDNCQEDCKPCNPAFPLVDAPLQENITNDGKKYTAGMVQYVSDGTYDDHHVLTKNSDGQVQSRCFLGTAAKDGAPTILKVK